MVRAEKPPPEHVKEIKEVSLVCCNSANPIFIYILVKILLRNIVGVCLECKKGNN